MRCYFVTFGCKVNQCETAGMQEAFSAAGFSVCSDPAEADCIIFNSCTVTAAGDSRLFAAIRKMRKAYPAAKLILTGCYPQAYPEKSAAIPDLSLICGTKDRSALPEKVQALLQGGSPAIDISAYGSGDPFESLPSPPLPGHTRGFLKIQDGCNRFCTYCIVPYARGRCRSMPLESVGERAAGLGESGCREVVLCGINLGFYGLEWHGHVGQAAQKAAESEKIARVRLGSLEPERMTAEVIESLASCQKLCPQFHLSLQSGCDRTLKRMGRRYTTAEYAHLAQSLRRIFPGCAITTDFMVGFPGETMADFEESLAFAEEIRFAHTHVFPYSPRPGTKAATYPEQIPPSEKHARMQKALALAKKSERAFVEAMAGRREAVLFERETPDGYHVGRCPNGVLVRLPADGEKSLRGRLLSVIINPAYLEGDG